jgi:hypothetical protein
MSPGLQLHIHKYNSAHSSECQKKIEWNIKTIWGFSKAPKKKKNHLGHIFES